MFQGTDGRPSAPTLRDSVPRVSPPPWVVVGSPRLGGSPRTSRPGVQPCPSDPVPGPYCPGVSSSPTRRASGRRRVLWSGLGRTRGRTRTDTGDRVCRGDRRGPRVSVGPISRLCSGHPPRAGPHRLRGPGRGAHPLHRVVPMRAPSVPVAPGTDPVSNPV